jgi:probable H4MPT-linked C1 transfer pathway protein
MRNAERGMRKEEIAIVGLDIGGANLKAADGLGAARSRPFALWKAPDRLAAELRALLADLPPPDRLAVTMTGELCDCFATRAAGVRHILGAVADLGRPLRVWRTDGRFCSADEAGAEPLTVASANWHALAAFAGRFAPTGPALLLDVGTTTTDVIPLRDGVPVPLGRTDAQRLRSGELVYKGWRRTPLCALTDGDGAAELFATALDVFLALGLVAEDEADTDTADGRPATRACAHARLARMLGADADTRGERETREFAEAVRRRLVRLVVERGIEPVVGRLGRPRCVVLGGSGELLGRAALAEQGLSGGCELVSLAERLGPAVSSAACAHAVAVLAREREG